MAQQFVPRGLMVVYSAGAGERALDNLGPGDLDPNGLFVRELMPELRRQGVPLDDAGTTVSDSGRNCSRRGLRPLAGRSGLGARPNWSLNSKLG